MSFLAVSSSHFKKEAQSFFSPRMMRWEDDVMIFDLRPCRLFWQNHADQRGVSLTELFKDLVSEITNETATSFAVVAETPWRAVLMLDHLREKNLTGLVSLYDSFSKGLFSQISWASWWRSCHLFSTHQHVMTRFSRGSRWNSTTFQRQSTQLQKSARRLGLDRPSDLTRVSTTGIQRRFGAQLRELWEQAFLGGTADPSTTHEFPWINHETKELPSVKRHLDYGLEAWDHIQPILQEDLDRLCRTEVKIQDMRIVSLEWRLTFADLTSHPIAIQYRHPHCLYREIGHHKTTLLQAYYNFQVPRATEDQSTVSAAAKDAVRIVKDESQTKTVIAWSLQVKEQMTMPLVTSQLFTEGSTEKSRLLDLENLLPTALEKYSLTEDWQPESAYVSKEAATPSQDLTDLTHLYLEGAKNRPLYIFNCPEPLPRFEGSTLWKFLERTMCHWWKKDLKAPNYRDYYCLIDSNQKRHWVFKDNKGRTYQHGLFA
jgi:hypothetical protein